MFWLQQRSRGLGNESKGLLPEAHLVEEIALDIAMDFVEEFSPVVRKALEEVKFGGGIFEDGKGEEGKGGKIDELGFLEGGKMAQDFVGIGLGRGNIFGLFSAGKGGKSGFWGRAARCVGFDEFGGFDGDETGIDAEDTEAEEGFSGGGKTVDDVEFVVSGFKGIADIARDHILSFVGP